MYAAVNTAGLRNGNWTRKAKTQGGEDGGRDGGGGGRATQESCKAEKKRTVPNTSRWGALMFDSRMIPRGDPLLPPAGTVWSKKSWHDTQPSSRRTPSEEDDCVSR